MVKQEIINFGIVDQDGSTELEWELTIDPSEIVHIVPDCGCTTAARVDKDTKTIKATFTEDDAKELTDTQKNDWYPGGQLPISKGLIVYLRDEHDLIILDEHNKSVFNPKKRKASIGFAGYCKLK